MVVGGGIITHHYVLWQKHGFKIIKAIHGATGWVLIFMFHKTGFEAKKKNEAIETMIYDEAFGR